MAHGLQSNCQESLIVLLKVLFFSNMVQPINLIICNIIEMIEQNIFDHADFSLRS